MTISRDKVFLVVKKIIQVDLKFSGIEVVDELQLVGGGLGLDSLDLLMLVTGIDKEFAYKISPKKLNQDSMSTVGKFVDFVFSELAAAGL